VQKTLAVFGDKKIKCMKKSELKQLIKEEIIQQKLLEEKNKKASKINQNLSNLIEKIKKDFNI